jgi:hypothetical protein
LLWAAVQEGERYNETYEFWADDTDATKRSNLLVGGAAACVAE